MVKLVNPNQSNETEYVQLKDGTHVHVKKEGVIFSDDKEMKPIVDDLLAKGWKEVKEKKAAPAAN